jgi:hypothetical protein
LNEGFIMSNLPAPSSATPPSDLDAWDLWHDVVVEIKKRIMQPSFWQAVEAVIPITVDDKTLVVGLPVAAGYYSSHLTGNENRNQIERIIQDLLGYRLTFRLIEGTEESDWEDVKRREEAAKSAQQAFRSRFDGGPAVSSSSPNASGEAPVRTVLTWESLMERIFATYSRSQGHHLPQGRVQYLLLVLPVIAEGSQKLMEAAPHDKDRNERALARILDKVAGLVEVPSAVVALELARYQQSAKKRAGG